MSERTLIIEADGGSRGNPGHAGFGAVVLDGASGETLAERAGYIGTASNNVAEYRGLIAGLEAARAIDPAAAILVRMDSKLVVEQMSGRWKIKHPDMKPLALQARDTAHGARITYEWIPRESNKRADALANEAMDSRNGDIRRDHTGVGHSAGDDTPVENAATRGTPLFAVKGGDLVSSLTLVMVRHGVTDMTVTNKLSGSGQVGPPLNAAGKVQAAKAADAIYRIGRKTWDRVPKATRLMASPMVRTQDTAAAIGRRLGLKVETDERLKEIDFGDWEGMTGEEVAERFGDAIHRWRFGEHAPPGGETIPEVGARMDAVVRELAVEHAELCTTDDAARTYVLTSHAVAIKAAVGLSMGIDSRSWGSMWPQPASLTILQLRVTQQGEIAERHLLCLGAPVD